MQSPVIAIRLPSFRSVLVAFSGYAGFVFFFYFFR
jgi:hypothetical protein